MVEQRHHPVHRPRPPRRSRPCRTPSSTRIRSSTASPPASRPPQAGADEALMLDPHGFVATCNSTHFFIVRKGEVWTSTGDYCLGGITRGERDRDLPRAGHPGLREEFLADRRLWRRGGVRHRHLRRRRAGARRSTGGTITDGRGPMVERLQGLYRARIEADVAKAGAAVMDRSGSPCGPARATSRPR